MSEHALCLTDLLMQAADRRPASGRRYADERGYVPQSHPALLTEAQRVLRGLWPGRSVVRCLGRPSGGDTEQWAVLLGKIQRNPRAGPHSPSSRMRNITVCATGTSWKARRRA
jgi:hypothetical protein